MIHIAGPIKKDSNPHKCNFTGDGKNMYNQNLKQLVQLLVKPLLLIKLHKIFVTRCEMYWKKNLVLKKNRARAFLHEFNDIYAV